MLRVALFYPPGVDRDELVRRLARQAHVGSLDVHDDLQAQRGVRDALQADVVLILIDSEAQLEIVKRHLAGGHQDGPTVVALTPRARQAWFEARGSPGVAHVFPVPPTWHGEEVDRDLDRLLSEIEGARSGAMGFIESGGTAGAKGRRSFGFDEIYERARVGSADTDVEGLVGRSDLGSFLREAQRAGIGASNRLAKSAPTPYTPGKTSPTGAPAAKPMKATPVVPPTSGPTAERPRSGRPSRPRVQTGATPQHAACYCPSWCLPRRQSSVWVYLLEPEVRADVEREAREGMGSPGNPARGSPSLPLCRGLSEGERVTAIVMLEGVSFDQPIATAWRPPYVRIVVPFMPSVRLAPGDHRAAVTVLAVGRRGGSSPRDGEVLAQLDFELRIVHQTPGRERTRWLLGASGCIAGLATMAATMAGVIAPSLGLAVGTATMGSGLGAAVWLAPRHHESLLTDSIDTLLGAARSGPESKAPSARRRPDDPSRWTPKIASLAEDAFRRSTIEPMIATQLARQCAEAILQHVHHEDIGPPDAHAAFDALLRRLCERGLLPTRVHLPFGTVQVFGNRASHPDPEAWQPWDAWPAMAALGAILRWYFQERMNQALPAGIRVPEFEV